MIAGQKKSEGQWTGDERKAANLDQRLKSLIMSVLPDDQMNSVINCLTAKSTSDYLIPYHEGTSDVKESRFGDYLSDDCVNYSICDICGSYDHDTHGHNMIISLRRGIKPKNPQYVMKSYETCGSIVHTTTDHNDIEWFRRGEELQAKKAKALKSSKAKFSNANSSKTSTKRHMTGVKSYLHKYMEQPGPKMVFGDDSTCTTEGYGSIKCNDHLGKFDEKADDGYLLRYSLVSKAFRVFNTRRQKTKEIYHIIFDESPDAIKFSKPLVDNINIAKNERYPPDEYLHSYEPSQRGYFSTKYNSISNSPLSIPSMFTPAPQDRWSQDKHIELVSIIGNPGARMLTRSMAKELGAALTYKCIFVDFIFEEEPKKVSESIQHLRWVDSMQD
uniref:Retrovirus-related Pol polyprotein from transposon TNT 1-94 n=1 Tax=Tanacetum cinerariifolium TaxID=118510 RepID=A0A6L2KM43_TANCI|nr:retrovirus-related Pol polyprotein from transposon TNT 1-94 [Tanacetum cinerariifolium]